LKTRRSSGSSTPALCPNPTTGCSAGWTRAQLPVHRSVISTRRHGAPFPAGRDKWNTSPYGRPPACRIPRRRGSAELARWTFRRKFVSTMTRRTSRGSVGRGPTGTGRPLAGLNVDTLDGPKWFWVGAHGPRSPVSGLRSTVHGPRSTVHGRRSNGLQGERHSYRGPWAVGRRR
jgi:hypothetical protein